MYMHVCTHLWCTHVHMYGLILVHTYRDECTAQWGKPAWLCVLIKDSINSLSRQQAKNSTAIHHPNSSYCTWSWPYTSYPHTQLNTRIILAVLECHAFARRWSVVSYMRVSNKTLVTHGHGCMSASSTKCMSVTMSRWKAYSMLSGVQWTELQGGCSSTCCQHMSERSGR